MIVVLCDSFEEAVSAFKIFLDFLLNNEPWHRLKIFDYANMVETDDNLRYIFVSYEYSETFKNMKPDLVDLYDFLNGIDEFYYSRQGGSVWDELA